MAKVMTRSEAEEKQRKAVEFLRRIGKPEDAERFAQMTREDYAAHKHAELMANPFRRYRIMGARSRPHQSGVDRAD